MSARDALTAYVAHFSDADQAEYEKCLNAYAAEIRAQVLREAAEAGEEVANRMHAMGSDGRASGAYHVVDELRRAADEAEAGEAKPSARDELPAGEDDLPF